MKMISRLFLFSVFYSYTMYYEIRINDRYIEHNNLKIQEMQKA